MRLFLLCLFIFSCGGNSELTRINFTQYVDSHNLRIFGKEDVDPDFLDKVASSYDSMFGDNFKIN